MIELVQSFAQVVMTNNCVGRRGSYPESRRTCLEKLNGCICQGASRIYSRPVNLLELINDLIAKFTGVLWRKSAYLKTLVNGDPAVAPTFCGECAVCMEPIE